MVDCSTGERVDGIWVNLRSVQRQEQEQQEEHDDDDSSGGARQPRDCQRESSTVSPPSILSLRVTPDQAKVSRAPLRHVLRGFHQTRMYVCMMR